MTTVNDEAGTTAEWNSSTNEDGSISDAPKTEGDDQLEEEESTSSTDRLLNTRRQSLSSNATIGAHVLHSIPPKTSERVRRPYQPTTVSKHAKYDKVPTHEIICSPEDESTRNTSLYTRNGSKTNRGKMVVDNQSQCQENMKQIFTTEEQMRPLKDITSLQMPYDSEGRSSKTRLFRQLIAAISVSLASMVVGFVTGYTSPATDSMKALQDDHFPVSEEAISWIGGIMPLSALIGGILGGQLIDWRGRRNTIMMTAPFFVSASLLIAFAENVSMILVGRAVQGVCVGILSLSLPVYLGETLRPEVRGTLGLLPTALGNTGILVCFLAGKYLNWWELAILGAVIPIPFLVLMFIIPETPRWHMSKGNIESARHALQWLRGKCTEIGKEFEEIENSNAESIKQGSDSKIKSLMAPSCLKPLIILIGLMFFQQMSGINAVIFYTVTIFKDAGSTIDEKLCTIIVGIVNFMSTFLATTLIDRLGRKILLYISAVSMIITLGTLGAFFYCKNTGHEMSDYGWLPLASFVIYVIGFSLGLGPVPWLMMGEILPSSARGSAASITTAFNWMCTFVVTKTFKDVIEQLGNHGAFWMFGCICFLSLFFVYFCVPETRGKSLEDIERKYNECRKGANPRCSA